MTEMEILKLVLYLVEEYGPDAVGMISEISRSLCPTDAFTFCTEKTRDGAACGLKCPVYQIEVNGRKIFRGKCSTHGFKRSEDKA